MKESIIQKFLATLMVLVCFSFLPGNHPNKFRKPELSPEKQQLNILLFTVNDLDRNSLGCFGSTVPDISPNIDRFAAQSLRFERSFVNAAICVPCRGMIATGLYGYNSGITGFNQLEPGSAIPTIMEILRAKNYEVGCIGKLRHSTPKKDFHWDYGFEQTDPGFGRNPSFYYQKTKTFFDQCRQKNKPFYLMVNSHDPHRPFFNPNSPRANGEEAPSRIYAASEISVPGFVPDLPKVREELSYYYNSTRRLDDTFGKVMQALEESGLAQNTLVVFISDNGIALPFAKANVYYASNRSPFIIRWPGVTKAGSVNSSDMVSIIDFLPTVLEALEIEAPKKIDGRSFLPLLKGEKQSGRDVAYMEINYKSFGGPVPMRSVETRQWNYIYNAWADGERNYAAAGEGMTMQAMEEAAVSDNVIAARLKLYRLRVPEELYDISNDPDCLNNLVNEPGLQNQLNMLRNEMGKFMIKTNDPLLKVYRNRKTPAVALKEFYDIYPEAVERDKNKAGYSRTRN